MCEICDKRFKTPEFVHKHIFNKHKDKLDEKFNKIRFDQMFRENYIDDPNKLINTPMPSHGGGGYGGYHGGGGYRDRGGYRKRYEGGGSHFDRDRDERKKRDYIDYDDPQRYQQQHQNPERQLVSYDDLF